MQIKDLDYALSKVTLPARYIGGETNMVIKDGGHIRYALFFPDLYDIGMSNLGMQILYFLLNNRADTYCERAFSPWSDMESVMRDINIPLYSLETFTPLKEFDIIGVSLQYELCYTNVLNMLDLSGIPIFSKDRDDSYPLIMAGGMCAYNPEPLAEIIDCFYIGEGEAVLNGFMDLYASHKREGGTKQQLLRKLAGLSSIYVPSLYNISYNDDGTIMEHKPNTITAPKTVKKAYVENPDKMFMPDKLLIPLIEIAQGRVVTEIFRGCIRGCRFCQAGFVNRPQREKSKTLIADMIKKLMDDSGYEEISLMSLSTSDYSSIKELIPAILERLGDERASISLPSLRVDNFSLELFENLYSMKKNSLTFAPEAGTERLRNVINKNLTEEEIISGVQNAYALGYDRIKLYFMSGLPTETAEDLDGIAVLCSKIVDEYYKLPKEARKRPVSISASVSYFVPKPHTPFQWDKQVPAEEFLQNQKRVKSGIARRQIRYTYHAAEMGVIEGALSSGDRKVVNAVYNAFKSGCRFDGWSECFNFNNWKNAFEDAGLSLEFYNNRKRNYDEVLPWDHIDCGVSKEYLIKERKKADNESATPNCREKCGNCGLREVCNETEIKI